MLNDKKRVDWFPYILIMPGIILILCVIFILFLQNIYYSFTNYSLLNKDMEFTGLENYRDILTGRDFFPALGKSFTWVLLNMIFMILLGLLGAFLLNSSTIKGTIVLEVFLLIPWILPEVVTGYTWKLLLNYQTGPYYQLLETLHIIPEGADIFSNSTYAMLAVTFANVWRSFPLVSVMVYAKLQTLSKDQIEAAVIDGAKRFRIFLKLELPHVASTLASVMTLCFVWTFNAFGIIHIMTGGGPAGATEVLPVHLQRSAFQFYNYSYSSAFAVLMIIVLVLVVVILSNLPRLLARRSDNNKHA